MDACEGRKTDSRTPQRVTQRGLIPEAKGCAARKMTHQRPALALCEETSQRWELCRRHDRHSHEELNPLDRVLRGAEPLAPSRQPENAGPQVAPRPLIEALSRESAIREADFVEAESESFRHRLDIATVESAQSLASLGTQRRLKRHAGQSSC
jgi:hypothetical protein